MSEIRSALLIPAEGDPHELLREGPCGARPPVVVLLAGSHHELTVRGPCECECIEDDECPVDCCAVEGRQECGWCGDPWPCLDAGKRATPDRWASGRYYGSVKGRRALGLAWDGRPMAAGMTPALAALAKAMGCPHAPHLLAWADDIYRRARAWRVVAFTGGNSRGRWGHTFVGSPHQYPGVVHVPGIMGADRADPLAPALALGLVMAHVGLGTLVLLDADGCEVTP